MTKKLKVFEVLNFICGVKLGARDIILQGLIFLFIQVDFAGADDNGQGRFLMACCASSTCKNP